MIDKQEFILRWRECGLSVKDPHYQDCQACKYITACFKAAMDSYSGQQTFDDMVTHDGYTSANDFWETNGI